VITRHILVALASLATACHHSTSGLQAPAEPGVYTPDSVAVRPELAPNSCTPLPPPRTAEEGVITGTVVVSFVIDTTGRAEATSIRVITYSDGRLLEWAKQTVLHCRYRVGIRDGEPVRVRVTQPLSIRPM